MGWQIQTYQLIYQGIALRFYHHSFILIFSALYTLNAIAKTERTSQSLRNLRFLFLAQRTIIFVVFTGTMMSSPEDAFWITGPLWGESIGY